MPEKAKDSSKQRKRNYWLNATTTDIGGNKAYLLKPEKALCTKR
jgi:hypothetical protein